jgi:predicted transcriptional regulator
MRPLIDIPDDHVRALARIAAREDVSRAALIRRAIAHLIASESPAMAHAAFGLWTDGAEGLAYQDRLRAEW